MEQGFYRFPCIVVSEGMRNLPLEQPEGLTSIPTLQPECLISQTRPFMTMFGDCPMPGLR